MDLVRAVDYIAREFDGSDTEARVLLCLVSHADKSGVSWPGYATICRETRKSRSTVIRAVGSLRRRGLLSVDPRHDAAGRQTSNRYRLTLPYRGVAGDTQRNPD